MIDVERRACALCALSVQRCRLGYRRRIFLLKYRYDDCRMSTNGHPAVGRLYQRVRGAMRRTGEFSIYCCPVNFKTAEKSGLSDIWNDAATTERLLSPEFGLPSRSLIPPISAPSAPISIFNARALRARPAFSVICLHLFTTRP